MGTANISSVSPLSEQICCNLCGIFCGFVWCREFEIVYFKFVWTKFTNGQLNVLFSYQLIVWQRSSFQGPLDTFLTLSLPRVINFNFLFQSLTRDISHSMENLAIDSLLRWKSIEQSFLPTSLDHFLLEWLGEFALLLITQPTAL